MSYLNYMSYLIHYVLTDHKVPPEYMCFSRVPSLPNIRTTQSSPPCATSTKKTGRCLFLTGLMCLTHAPLKMSPMPLPLAHRASGSSLLAI
ncbi:unnamed protein product [Prunus armeniaca]